MDRRSLLVGFLAGGWLVTAVALSGYSPFGAARAQDAPGAPNQPINPNTPTSPGRSVTPSDPQPGRGVPGQTTSTTAFNNRAIALTGTTAAGDTVVYYFDTELQRLLVYQYRSGEKGGVHLLSARHFDYDLKLEAYRDISERNRDEMKADYEKAFRAQAGGGDELPVKKVDLSGQK